MNFSGYTFLFQTPKILRSVFQMYMEERKFMIRESNFPVHGGNSDISFFLSLIFSFELIIPRYTTLFKLCNPFTGLLFWVLQLHSFCLLLLLFTPLEFFTSVLADGFSLEFEWQHVSSSLQDSYQYTGRPQQCCRLDSLYPSANFQVLQAL